MALDSPRVLLPELQRCKDTVRCAALGAEVPGHHQQQRTQTLIVRLLKTHFFQRSLTEKSHHNTIATRPACIQKIQRPGIDKSVQTELANDWINILHTMIVNFSTKVSDPEVDQIIRRLHPFPAHGPQTCQMSEGASEKAQELRDFVENAVGNTTLENILKLFSSRSVGN